MSQYSSIKSITVKHTKHPTHLERKYSDHKTSINTKRQSSIDRSSSISNLLSERKSCNNSRCQSVEPKIKVFKPQNKSEILMKNIIDKLFNQYLIDNNLGEMLSLNNVINLFSHLRFFSNPLAAKDLTSAQFIGSVLSRQSKGINKRNLLKLIYVVTNVSKDLNKFNIDNPCSGLRRDSDETDQNINELQIGYFDSNGSWIVNEEQQKLIKSKLGYVYYNRISNSNIKYSKQSNIQSENFQPKILASSSRMSLKHRRHLSSVFNLKVDNIHQRQIIYQKKHNQWLQRQSIDIQNKEIQNCAFKPLTNRSRVSSRYSSIIQDKNNKREQLKSMDKKEIQQLKECSFKPKLSLYKQNSNVPNVKNSSKVINRLQQAYKRKVEIDSYKQRGYPPSNYKITTNIQKGIKDKAPILCIDIKIKDQNDSLNIYEGELLQNLVCKILVKNKLPYEYMQKIQSLLKDIVKVSETACIKNGFVTAK